VYTWIQLIFSIFCSFHSHTCRRSCPDRNHHPNTLYRWGLQKSKITNNYGPRKKES